MLNDSLAYVPHSEEVMAEFARPRIKPTGAAVAVLHLVQRRRWSYDSVTAQGLLPANAGNTADLNHESTNYTPDPAVRGSNRVR